MDDQLSNLFFKKHNNCREEFSRVESIQLASEAIVNIIENNVTEVY